MWSFPAKMNVSVKNESKYPYLTKKYRRNQWLMWPEAPPIFVFSLFKQPGRFIVIFAYQNVRL
jgi:hypothetical protein